MDNDIKPQLKLIGTDGNVYAVLGRAQVAARKAGWSKEKINKFLKEATSGGYNNALATCCTYFDVK